MAEQGQWFSPGVPVRPKRISLSLPVRYRLVDGDQWHPGRTENISEAGVLIRGARLFSQNVNVELRLTLPGGILANAAGDMLFVGKVARLVNPTWSGGLPGIAIAFQQYRIIQADPPMPPSESAPGPESR